MTSSRAWAFTALLAALSAIGCASSAKKGSTAFVLVGGRKIGTLELVAEDKAFWPGKTRDSLQFDNQYLHSRPRIGFKYPGKSITLMKVFDGEKLLKSCDETSFSRKVFQPAPDIVTEPGVIKVGDGLVKVGPSGHFTPVPGGNPKPVETYSAKYDLECEVGALKEGMTIELHDPEGMVSKYKVVPPVP